MPTPEELVADDVKAAPDEGAVLTDKAEIEAALADTVKEELDEMTVLRNRISQILSDHNNEVTSIPRSSEYWQLQNRYNALRNP